MYLRWKNNVGGRLDITGNGVCLYVRMVLASPQFLFQYLMKKRKSIKKKYRLLMYFKDVNFRKLNIHGKYNEKKISWGGGPL